MRARFNKTSGSRKGCFRDSARARHRPCRVMSSNAGPGLWTGIVEEDKAGRVVHRLMRPDLFNGWGIRTLSYKERRYNPDGLSPGHRLAARQFADRGRVPALRTMKKRRRIFVGLLEAAMEFEDYRLPELFTGFGREEYGQPVRYPSHAIHRPGQRARFIPGRDIPGHHPGRLQQPAKNRQAISARVHQSGRATPCPNRSRPP